MKSVAEVIHLVQRLTAFNPTAKFSFVVVGRSKQECDRLYKDAACDQLMGQAGLFLYDHLRSYHMYLDTKDMEVSLKPTRKLAFVMGLPAGIEAIKGNPIVLQRLHCDLHESSMMLGLMIDDLIVEHHVFETEEAEDAA